MGRVKSLMIKKAAQELHKTLPEFSDDFEHNKKLLKGSIHYKSVRNKVAGEIVCLVKKQKLKNKVRDKEDDITERSEE